MKKLTAILLLTVHLFNLAGYSLLFQYLISKADSQFVQQLDTNSYSDKDLVEVKVPLNMPYINDTKEFERVDGQLEYKGVHYNYVKRKVSADTLYVLCLPNISKTQLSNAKAAYSKEINDIPTGKKTNDSIKKKGAYSEYSFLTNQFGVCNFIDLPTLNHPVITVTLANTCLSIPEQPPKAFS